MIQSKINKEKFMELYNQGLNDSEIAKHFDVTNKGIQCFRRKLNLPSNWHTKTISMNNFQKSVFIGTILGDGCLRKPKDCKNAGGSFGHSIKQEDYCKYKYKIFENLSGKLMYYTYKPDKRTGNIYSMCSFRLKNNPIFNYYYNELYKGTKRISKKILEEFDEISLAFLYMDDGNKHKNGYYISLNNFPLEDIKIFKQFLKNRFSLNCSIHSEKLIYIKSTSLEDFTKLIKPYVIESMRYKLHVLNKSGEFMETPVVDNHEPS